MPKVMLTAEQRRNERFRKEDEAILAKIGAYMLVNGMTLEEVGEKAGIKRSTMYERKKNPGSMSLNEYRRLMEVVGG